MAHRVRIGMRGLDEGFVYPCSKADVREIFGEGLLTNASFGWRPDYAYDVRAGAERVAGRVLVSLSVSTRRPDTDDWIGLSVFRVRREAWSDYLGWQVREAMRTRLRPWVEAMLARPETARDGSRQALIELREGLLHIHLPRV